MTYSCKMWVFQCQHDAHVAAYNCAMARPCKLDTVEFQRKLSDQDRAILLTAGQGDLTRGFKNLLSIYTVLHNQGFRPDDDIEQWLFSDNANHSQ